ncbi:MAG: class I SAM-dependent methyltransferase [Syntrophotaleaceae bacterium]
MASWAQSLLAEVLSPGELAVDLTAGNGRDTCFLQQILGPQGRILAFDIQLKALEITAGRLAGTAARIFGPSPADPGHPVIAGIHLIHACHGQLADYLREPADGIIANLGYLPGGDHRAKTVEATTRQALEQALALLKPGGRLAVVAYTGHEGAGEEAESVERIFSNLSPRFWNVLRLTAANRFRAPFLLVAEKRIDPGHDPE